MGTTADKLNRLINTKEGIRQEINRAYETEEISTSDTFNSYIQKLEEHPYYLKGLVEGTLESIKLSNVTSIDNGAFYGCSSLTEVSFPNAKSTGNQAFQYCSNLIEITDASFPKATYIDSSSFSSCSSLTKVSFPKATGMKFGAFSGCSSLTEVSIPLATSIGQSAFSGCSSLISVSFPKATDISSYAFSSCSSLTSVSFSNNVDGIWEKTFQYCSSLPNVSFPKVKSIGRYAFDSCSSLTEVSFPKATDIGSNAFSNCSSLTSVDIPNATSIGSNAFSSCSKFTSVSFPVATIISNSAFNGCSGLTEVSFPVATSIGSGAFSKCSSLTTIYVGTESDTVCTLSHTNAFDYCTNLTNIYVPYSLVDSYKSATNWSSYASKIKAIEQPVECIALSITADDVIGNATSTTIYYTAECTYTKEGIPQEGTKVFTGEVTSDSFEQNTSTTDTVQRTISFTFLGKTATATITQGVWSDKFIYVTTEGISSYGWVTADSKYNVDRYDVYMSNNKGVDDSNAVMKLECVGYTDLTLYIRSYAESNYDYTIASIANASTYPKDSSSSDTKAHTKGKQNSGTTLSDYTAVTYTGLKDNDIIYIVFRKDGSGSDYDDRGYVLIPK